MVRSRQEAEESLQDYYREFVECVVGAWSQYMEGAKELRPIVRSGSEAGFVRDLIIFQARKRFTGRPGINLMERGNLFVISVRGTWLIKIKKLRGKRSLRANNAPTMLANAFINQRQLELEGMPEDATNLFLGWMLSPTRSAVDSIYLVCPDGSRLHWSWPLSQSGDTAAGGLPAVIPSAPFGDSSGARVQIRRETVEEAGQDKEQTNG